MEISVPEEVVDNWILDLKKKEMHPIDRAKLLIKIREAKGFPSQRVAAKYYGISPISWQDYERWAIINKKEYAQMEEQGLNKTDIYRQLRDNVSQPKEKFIEKVKIDIEIEKFHTLLRSAIAQKQFSNITSEKAKALLNDLNRLLMYAERDR